MEMKDALRVAISRVHYPVTSLGQGRRLGIWFQGCSIGCLGCVSPDTWEVKGDEWIEVQQLVDDCCHFVKEADGVTISGGEPFEQPEALNSLIKAIRATRDLHFIVYSGFSFSYLNKMHSKILGELDVLISGPYIRGLEKLPLRGSRNQEIHEINKHRARGGENPDMRLDMSLCQNGEVHLAGIL